MASVKSFSNTYQGMFRRLFGTKAILAFKDYYLSRKFAKRLEVIFSISLSSSQDYKEQRWVYNLEPC